MKTRTPKYRVELSFINFSARKRDVLIIEWRVRGNAQLKIKGYGQPTEANAKTLRDDLNASLAEGGVNAHLRAGQSDYSTTTIIEQSTGRVVATYTPPMFETV